MNGSGYLLIGYHAIDVEFAIQFALDLKNQGVNVWLDRFEIMPEDDWSATLHSALSDCAAFMPILSPDYVTSHYGQHEVNFIYRSNKPILPVLLRHVHATDWLNQVGYDHVDMTDWQSEAHYQTSFNILRERIEALALVRTTRIVNPEIRYINQIIAQAERQKAILTFVKITHPSPSHNEPEYRPEPTVEATWGLNGPFLLRHENQTRVIADLREIRQQHPHYVLIGTDGIGKTTTLQRLVLEEALLQQDDSRHLPLPLYISLADWRADETLIEFLQRHWWLKSDITEWIEEGRLSLYFDDLDALVEDNSRHYHVFKTWLNQQPEQTHIIIACHEQTYIQITPLELPLVYIESMVASRVEAAVARTLGAQNAMLFWQKLFPESRWEWALRNPLYLNLLLFVYQHSPLADLPSSPAALLWRWLNMNWEREQILQHPNWVPLGDVIHALSEWAFEVFRTSSSAYHNSNRAHQYLPEEGLWHLLSSAHVVRLNRQQYHITHKILLKFLVAHRLQQENIHDYLTHPIIHPQNYRVYQRWDDVLMILTGFEENGEYHLRHIAEVDPFLGIMALINGCQVNDFMRRQLTLMLMRYTLEKTPELHDYAVQLLHRLYEGDATHILLDLMRQGTWQDRIQATQFMVQIPVTIPSDLAATVEAWDWKIDMGVLSHLRFMIEDALPFLMHALTHKDWLHRRGAAWALGELGDKAAVVALYHQLSDGDALVRREVINSLKRLHDGAVVEGLVQALLDEDVGVRKMAVYAVIHMGVTAIPSLLRLLEKPDLQTKRIAIGVLGKLGDTSIVPNIIHYLKDDVADIRAVTVNALGELRDPDAVDALALCLQDEAKPLWSSQTISSLTQIALEKIGTEKAMNLLSKILRKKSGKKESSAQRAKAMLKQQSSRHASLNAQTEKTSSDLSSSDSEKEIPSASIQAPSSIHNDWVNKLEATDWQARQHAIENLAVTGAPQYLPAILDGLDDSESQVRWAAVKGLIHYPPEATLRGLEKALYDSEIVVAMVAADVLKQIGAPALPLFQRALQSVSADVRAIAVDALAIIGDESVVDDLRLLRHDNDVPRFDKSKRISERVHQALYHLGAPSEPSMPVTQPDTLSTPTDLPTQEDFIILPDWEPPTGVDTEHNEQHVYSKIHQAQAMAAPVGQESVWLSTWQTLLSSEWHTQEQAAKDLIQIVKSHDMTRDTYFIETITSGLSHSDSMIRLVCVEALAWIGDIHSVPLLIQSLEDEHWTVRVAIIRTLAKIGHATAIPSLITLLRDEHELVREVAAQSLGELHATSAVDDLLQSLDDEGFVVRAVIEALGEIGHSGAIHHLIDLLPLADESLQWTIIEALGKMRARQAVDLLIPYLEVSYRPLWDKTGEQDIARITAIALERIGTQKAHQALQQWRSQKV